MTEGPKHVPKGTLCGENNKPCPPWAVPAPENGFFAQFALHAHHKHTTCTFYSTEVQPFGLKGKSWSLKKFLGFAGQRKKIYKNSYKNFLKKFFHEEIF